MSKISCEIIKDLLPLYYDNVCSSESRKMVEEHLSECTKCTDELNKIGTDLALPKETIEQNLKDSNAMKNAGIFLKRYKVKSFIFGLIGAAALFTIIFLSFTWPILDVPTDVVKITDLSQLEDGRIVYHVELTDGYELNRIKFNMDENGNFYLTPKRPLIKKKRMVDLPGLASTYYSFDDFLKTIYRDKYGEDGEIKALYYGSPKDNILIWKKGIDLPKASPKIEAYFNDESNSYMPY